MDFWGHLDELRGCLVRAIVAVVIAAVAAFCCKEWLFAVVMAPSQPGFVTYRLFERLTGIKSDFHIDLPMLWIGLALWLGSMATLYILEAAGLKLTGQDTLMDLGKMMFRNAPIFTLLMLCLFQPILEELSFRFVEQPQACLHCVKGLRPYPPLHY